MGKFRSKSGCLTCRSRRVKCDETHPTCGQCSKKNRPCSWEPQNTKFHEYDPTSSGFVGSSATARTEIVGGAGSQHADVAGIPDTQRKRGRTEQQPDDLSSEQQSTPGQHSQRSVSRISADISTVESPRSETFAGGIPISWLLRRSDSHSSEGSQIRLSHQQLPLRDLLPLSRYEASLIHHYAEKLGRWLDCTDAARQFTLRAPVQVKDCASLRYAVLAFAAKHRGDGSTALEAYQNCIEIVIGRLSESSAKDDDRLLCTIVILRFFEQLNGNVCTVSTSTGSDNEQHLGGCAAILRLSQVRTVDPSSPTLRESAFWVYVRQSLYNATINQVPPDLDFSLQLDPQPDQMTDSHPLAQLRLETAWSNQILWLCACIANHCFSGSSNYNAMPVWNELVVAVQNWANSRPPSFDPIWSGEADTGNVFPEIMFTADWHVVAYGYYHLACILLLRYKPGPKFAMRNIGASLTDEEYQILEHAYAICGACNSSPETVPIIITLCHTVFIWGPLLSVREEQEAILELLAYAESSHAWPTAWITNALKGQWGIE
ncbi:hypothetical protein BS50DRAFT_649350 [Corynespora cassiicola Philippines]|uniref:Zn(2)-C6 fungal-type domain-containing protein n=1 Tax=Corynespora cassiicola Philippines TaxID=1448308 RepID=A0A2T2NAF9_CORCC|nr:hypothetical protein BS50DRAFT_649350 [Corynespora cassiicola Philippines]